MPWRFSFTTRFAAFSLCRSASACPIRPQSGRVKHGPVTGLSSPASPAMKYLSWITGKTAVDLQTKKKRPCYPRMVSGTDTHSIKLSNTGSQMQSQRFAMVYQHDVASKPHSIPLFLIIFRLKWLGQTNLRYYPMSSGDHDIPQHATIHCPFPSALLLGIIPKSAPQHQTMQLCRNLTWPTCGVCETLQWGLSVLSS